MGISARSIAIFAAGAVVGAAAGGGAALLERSPALHRAFGHRDAAPTAERANAPAIAQGTPCPDTTSLAAAAAGDGQFKLVDSIADKRAGDSSALIVIGKEAAAAGRARDAEVAFIMACRVAGQMHGDPVALADAKYELAWHYGNVARDSSPQRRDELSQQARALYGDALRIYSARLGSGSEKATFAANGLAALQQPAAPVQATAQTEQPPAPEPASVTAASRRSDTRVAGAAGAVAPRASRPPQSAPQRLRPSFDCTRARSTSEKLICADPQLAQLDRELGRLHARAKTVTNDPAGFKRRNDEQWRRREASCRDRECLLAWYAQRRAELLDVIDSQAQRARASAD